MRRAPQRGDQNPAASGTTERRIDPTPGLGETASIKMSTGFQKPVEGDLDVGDTLHVTIGQETFSPEKYTTFTVGPIGTTVKIRQGETVADAYARAHRLAALAFDAEFEIKLNGWRKRHAEIAR